MVMVEHTQRPPHKARFAVGQMLYHAQIRLVCAVQHYGENRNTVPRQPGAISCEYFLRDVHGFALCCSNQPATYSILVMWWLGRLRIPCGSSGTRTNTDSIFRSFNAS